MKSIPLLAVLLLFAVVAGRAAADQDAGSTGQLSAGETAFVSDISKYLSARFLTAASAERAGYVRYTNEDETGAISYANMRWQSTESHQPSQLWYDKNGRLLGADYSVLVSGSGAPPQLWGVNPARWVEVEGHIHWVARDPATGQLRYDQYVSEKAFAAAGGDVAEPKPATLVAMKKVPSAGDVVTIFHFPAIWDLVVWVTPNPEGPFAWKNPLVQP